MPAKAAPVRLSKAAKEFNVGTSTIIEYLASKGIPLENNPNSKIETGVYQILMEEFADSKEIKEKSKMVGVLPGKRETVSINPEKSEIAKPKPPVEVEEVLIKNVQSAEDIIRPMVARSPGLNVVGRIDLDKKKPAPQPVEKPAPEPEVKLEPAKPEPEAEKPVVELKDEVAAPAKEVAAPVEAKKAAPAVEGPRVIETIRSSAGKLAGVNVVGKIDLPERPKKVAKPVMSTNPDQETQQNRKKRKRITTITPGQTNQSAGGNQQRPGNNNNSNNNNNNRKGAPAAKTGLRQEVSQDDIQRELRETLAKMNSTGNKSKGAKNRRIKRDDYSRKLEERELQAAEDSKILRLTEFVTVSDLASLMGVSVTEVISACMSLGIMASINQRLDAETISIVTEEFGYTVEFTSAEVAESIQLEADKAEDLLERAPIVTVMGHVDHGKTSLLDYIREENVIAGEAGGITQHIGAYSVERKDGRKITFLDTPGHEAFTAMRARGAQVTDLAIIVVSADDSVMPQTREAINHAQAAGIPMIFAINKIDKPDANPERIKEQLAAMNILVEDWGGKFQSQEISAKKGTNVEELLEKVLLEADLLELKANPKKNALGTIIESSLDKGRGFVSTLIVEGGTLKVGDVVLAGHYSGRVKAMFNERGTAIINAGPSTPVSMLGLNGAPNAGDKFHVLDDEREARTIAAKREQLQREQGVRTQKHITLDEIGRRIAIGDFKELNIILKGDVDGSVEALADSLQKLSTSKVQVNVIHKAVGQITESDVLLASASDAIIVGFQVRPSAGARRLAEKEEIQIKTYSIIYAAIEEIKDAMEGMLSAKIEEKVVGNAEIRETFKITKVGTIAGCFVTDGKISRNSKIRLIRDGIVVYNGHLGSLKRFKDDVREVVKGYECGLNIDKFNDIKEGDMIEAYEEVEVKQTLDS